MFGRRFYSISYPYGWFKPPQQPDTNYSSNSNADEQTPDDPSDTNELQKRNEIENMDSSQAERNLTMQVDVLKPGFK